MSEQENYITLETIRRRDFEQRLEAWRHCGTPLYELAAKEIDDLRSLVDEQLLAMDNTPAADMNYAGTNWRDRAKAIRKQSIDLLEQQ